MGWKNWPSWLKGSFVGVIAWSIYYLCSGIWNIFSSYEVALHLNRETFLYNLFLIISYPAKYVYSFHADTFPYSTNFIIDIILIILGIFLPGFIIGALIGWIYGKTKSKKKKK